MFGGLLILQFRGEPNAEVHSFPSFELALEMFKKFEEAPVNMELYKRVWTERRRARWPRYQLIRKK